MGQTMVAITVIVAFAALLGMLVRKARQFDFADIEVRGAVWNLLTFRIRGKNVPKS